MIDLIYFTLFCTRRKFDRTKKATKIWNNLLALHGVPMLFEKYRAHSTVTYCTAVPIK